MVLVIEDGIMVYNHTIASIKTCGIIGKKFMGLSPGGSGDLFPWEERLLIQNPVKIWNRSLANLSMAMWNNNAYDVGKWRSYA